MVTNSTSYAVRVNGVDEYKTNDILLAKSYYSTRTNQAKREGNGTLVQFVKTNTRTEIL